MGWMCRGAVLGAGLWAASGSWVSAGAQVRAVSVQTPEVAADLAGELGRLAARAGLIFVGTVERIDRNPDQHPGTVEITLHVEQALQGQPGAVYVLREWAGRWPPGMHRYTLGQRALFFLQAPSDAGLSSPVDGREGVVPVFGDPATGAVLDVQRLNATLLRPFGEKLKQGGTLKLEAAAQVIAESLQPGNRRPANPSGEEPLPIMVRGNIGARSAGGSSRAH